MGSRNHPCCEKNVNQPAAVATIQQSHALHPVFIAVMLYDASISLAVESEFHHEKFAAPPHSPPTLHSPLRI